MTIPVRKGQLFSRDGTKMKQKGKWKQSWAIIDSTIEGDSSTKYQITQCWSAQVCSIQMSKVNLGRFRNYSHIVQNLQKMTIFKQR